MQGLVWVFPSPNEVVVAAEELPLTPELDDPESVDATNFFVRDTPCSWEALLVGKSLQPAAHVPFAHHALMGGTSCSQEPMQPGMSAAEEVLSGFKVEKGPCPMGGGPSAPLASFAPLSAPTLLKMMTRRLQKRRASFLGMVSAAFQLLQDGLESLHAPPFTSRSSQQRMWLID